MGRRVSAPVVLCVLLLVAATTAGASGPEPYWNSRPFSFWVDALGGGDAAMRQQAAEGVAALAIAHGGEAVARAVPALTANLLAAEALVRASSAGALEQMGPTARPASPVLLRLFVSDGELAVRRRAGLALGRIDASSTEVITQATQLLANDADAGVRLSAAILLSSSGTAAAGAVPALETALGDADVHVQLYAATALGRLGQRARATDVLVALLGHDLGPVRAEAASFLPDVAVKKADVVPPLMVALRDPDGEVRAAAASALGTLGKPARSALRPLFLLLSDPNETVRERANVALAAIRN
jgi:HEAT repeat protein